MRWLDPLERRFGRFAVANLTIALVMAWIVAFLLCIARPEVFAAMTLDPGKIMTGEWWRIFTVLLLPPVPPGDMLSYLFFFFGVYIFFLMGGALESQWGAFRYNAFIFILWLLLIATSFGAHATADQAIQEQIVITNHHVALGVFLGFAWLYPNFTILLFLILPIKIKWIALITWAFIGLQLAIFPLPIKILALTPAIGFALFFGGDVIRRVNQKQRSAVNKAVEARRDAVAFHTCSVCGITDKDDPDVGFRVITDKNGKSVDICERCLDKQKKAAAEQAS